MPDSVVPSDPRVARPAGFALDGVSAGLRARVLEAIESLTHDGAPADGEWRVTELGGGASNLNFRVEGPDGTYVLRLPEGHAERFGTTQAAGVAIQSTAASAGIAPPVVAYHTPDGTSLVPFVEGRPLSAETVREHDMLERIGSLLRRLHAVRPVPARWSAFADIRRYVATAEREGLRLPVDMPALLHAVDRIEALLDDLPGVVAFCHNDLQPQNIIDDGARLWLIDWEYGGTGNRYFDLGNFAINVELDDGEVRRLLAAYGASAAERRADDARVALMRIVSAMREACWSVVAEPVLSNDWDYAAWAETYFARCRAALSSGDLARWLEEAVA